jgi:hypothetical protein
MGSWLGHWKIDFRPMLSSFAYQINNLVWDGFKLLKCFSRIEKV